MVMVEVSIEYPSKVAILIDSCQGMRLGWLLIGKLNGLTKELEAVDN
jgi:hypothetical protein